MASDIADEEVQTVSGLARRQTNLKRDHYLLGPPSLSEGQADGYGENGTFFRWFRLIEPARDLVGTEAVPSGHQFSPLSATLPIVAIDGAKPFALCQLLHYMPSITMR